MSDLTTSADLLDNILTRAGELTDGTSDLEALTLDFLNRAYRAIWAGGGEIEPTINCVWWWLRADDQGVLTLNPTISDGTVSVTNNSTSITFSSGPTPSVAGRHFKVNDHADVFIVSSHTAGNTAATLESVYTGTTDTAANYDVFQLDYDLASDLLYLSAPMHAFQDGRIEIYGITLAELARDWPLNLVYTGVPRRFAMIGTQKVRFSHGGGTSSTDLIKIDYEYTKVPSDLADDANEPLIPLAHRSIIADYALSLLLAKKEDSQANIYADLARRGLVAMYGEHTYRTARSGSNYGKILPRQGDVDRLTEPLRTESGVII